MKSAEPASRNRIFGLDLMRAVAILLVVAEHADDLLGEFVPVSEGVDRLDGVDLFFVLSGYLVGAILLRTAEAAAIPWHRRLLDFWQRRWLRTLPNYFLFLIVNIILVRVGFESGILNENTLAYFVFLQNFHVPLDLFFWESWSLAVEEWFYLLFPLLLFILLWLFRIPVRWSFLIAALAMIIVPTCFRSPSAEGLTSLFERDLFIRKLVVTRLDTIGYGVLAAWCHRYFEPAWSTWRTPLFILGLVALLAATLPDGIAHLGYLSTWYFTCVPIAVALFLPLLSTWRSRAAWTRPITFLSLVSYALYLINLPLSHAFLLAVEGQGLAMTIALYLAYWAVAITLAAAVYRWYERPFMEMRTRISARVSKPISPSS